MINFGMLHLARPEHALHEAHRILRPGGKFAFTVWAKPEEAIGFGIVLRAIQTHGDLNAPLPPGPAFFRFSETEECKQALLAAGFASPSVARVAQIWRLPSATALFDYMLNSTVRTAALLRAHAPDSLEQIRQAVRSAALGHQNGERVEIAMPAILASGVKP